MAESWEDNAETSHNNEDSASSKPSPFASRLDPKATSFTFNPGAAPFQPKSTKQATSRDESNATDGDGGAGSTEKTQQALDGNTTGSTSSRADSPPVDEAPENQVDNGDQPQRQASTTTTQSETKRQPRASTTEQPGRNKETAAEERRKQVESAAASEDPRPHMNVVFIGHVDAGKSTIGGQILSKTGMVDERTVQKYEKEAKEKNRESWYMAYVMDINEEERQKGKTVEVGRAHFATNRMRYTVLDAPGHKNYVPNMISGAAQADVGILVVAARRGEFETGFEKGGQTREHAQLAKTLGVTRLVIAVNKMDDPSVGWSKERFEEIESKITPFLKSTGYNPKRDVTFVPVSGLSGDNIGEAVSERICGWCEGACLLDTLDALDAREADPNKPFRMPVLDKYKDMGTMVMGKSEAGTVLKGDKVVVMPNKITAKISGLWSDESEVSIARSGENIRIRLESFEEENVHPGFVLCHPSSLVPAVVEFDATLNVLELLSHKAIFTAGYKAVLHIHSATEECEVIKLIAEVDPKTKKPLKKKCLFLKSGSLARVRIRTDQTVCLEAFSAVPQLGRFTLRDEGRTVAIGKVEKLRETV